jgi:hypothetical protein
MRRAAFFAVTLVLVAQALARLPDGRACAVLVRRRFATPHRLKPVLLDRAGPALWLHAWNRVNGINKFLVRNSR